MQQSLLIERLQSFKDKINAANFLDDKLAEFIAVEVFEFITKDNEILNNEFYRRYNYLSNLKTNKDFIKLQDDLFDTIVKITKLTTLDKVKEITGTYSTLGGSFINRLKDPDQYNPNKTTPDKTHTTLRGLYEDAQNKNNYYRLGDNGYNAPYEGEFSHQVLVIPIKSQYKQIKNVLIAILGANLEAILPNEKLVEKWHELVGKFDSLYYQLDEQIYTIPKKLHTDQFEKFFEFCVEEYEREGQELWHQLHKHKKHTEHKEMRLARIKQAASVVIDDLVEFLRNTDNAPVGVVKPIKKLAYYPSDGQTDYGSASYTFSAGTKAREFLDYLYKSKNTPLELKYFQTGCNDKIRIEKHRFKMDKDIVDTISYIKKNLGVKKGEYFPIYKRGKSFVWEER